MIRINIWIKIVFIHAIFLMILSCRHEDILLNLPRNDEVNIKLFLSNNFEYTIFTEALRRTDLLDLLEGDQEYTVLAVKNSIYQKAGINKVEDFANVPTDILKKMMSVYLIPKVIKNDDFSMDQHGQIVQTVGNDTLVINRTKIRELPSIGSSILNADITSISGAMIFNTFTAFDKTAELKNESDIACTNGYIHHLNKPIHWHKHLHVKEYLEQRPNYSIFVKMLKHFDYWDKISTFSQFTLFAPVNKTFELLGINEQTIDILDKSEYDVEKLLGSYFIKNRVVYISDLFFYFQTTGQRWVSFNLDSEKTLSQVLYYGRFQEQGAHHFRDLPEYYNIGVSNIKSPYRYQLQDFEDCNRFFGVGGDPHGDHSDDIMVNMLECIPYTSSYLFCDHLVKDGVVHETNGIMVHLNEAKL